MPQSQQLPAPPDSEDDLCQVCGAPAPFRERTLATGDVKLYCRHHIPADWGWMPKTLARLMEERYISLKAQNESSPPPGV